MTRQRGRGSKTVWTLSVTETCYFPIKELGVITVAVECVITVVIEGAITVVIAGVITVEEFHYKMKYPS